MTTPNTIPATGGVSDALFEQLDTLFSKHTANFNNNRDNTGVRAEIDALLAQSRPSSTQSAGIPPLHSVVGYDGDGTLHNLDVLFTDSTSAGLRVAVSLSAPPATSGPVNQDGLVGDAERLGYEIEESSSTRIEARIEAAALDKYTVLAFRDSADEDWSIIVTAPNGIKDYDGTWRNSSMKTTEEVISEAAGGAMLTPLPKPSLAYRPTIARPTKGA